MFLKIRSHKKRKKTPCIAWGYSTTEKLAAIRILKDHGVRILSKFEDPRAHRGSLIISSSHLSLKLFDASNIANSLSKSLVSKMFDKLSFHSLNNNKRIQSMGCGDHCSERNDLTWLVIIPVDCRHNGSPTFTRWFANGIMISGGGPIGVGDL